MLEKLPRFSQALTKLVTFSPLKQCTSVSWETSASRLGQVALPSIGVTFLSGISKWWILTKSKIACHELIQQAFGRTIGLNRLPLDCEYTDYDYFRGLAGAFARFHKELLAPEYIDPMLQECWDATIKRKKQACQERGTAFDEDGFLEFWWTSADISTFNLWGRRFFISGNVMGLAPDVAMEGDIICVPLGCPHPMIFRQVEDHYVVIGEAYVDDYMHGKAIEMMESGELELKEYELW